MVQVFLFVINSISMIHDKNTIKRSAFLERVVNAPRENKYCFPKIPKTILISIIKKQHKQINFNVFVETYFIIKLTKNIK